MTDRVRPRKLDGIDLKILEALQADGRLTNQRLSEMVGLSPRPCLERVRRLEAAGFIARYAAVLDPSLLANLVTVIAEVVLKDHTFQGRFERRLVDTPEVVECFLVSGPFDYVARVACPTLDRYRDLTNAWLEDPSLGVTRVVSQVVLRPVRPFAGYPLAAVAP